MKSSQMLVNLASRDAVSYVQPLLVNEQTRIMRWVLKPGERIEEHIVSDLPFYALILHGRGIFAGQDGNEEEYGPGSLLVFEPNETHSVRALAEELIFVCFLKSVESS